jgi:radical SAM superfamily enzyme YgiQ (UPF0313 family)
MYDGIVFCGGRSVTSGRNIAGYRLRTSAKKFGYNILVIDTATAMTMNELESILSNVITNRTLLLGISTSWLNNTAIKNNIEWSNQDFFNRLKSKYPTLNIVAGGNGPLKMDGSKDIYESADWHLVGFSDDSFRRLLMKLDKKSNHGLKYFPDSRGIKTVDSNKFHQILNPDDIETEFELEDNFLSHQPIPLEVSRGCIFRCAFCTHPFQGVKGADNYMRTSESLSREIKRNYELFGTTRYSIMDDTFNDSIEKLDRLERAIEMSKIPKFEFNCYLKPELLVTHPQMINQLLRMGLASGMAGIESYNNIARKSMNKGMSIDKILPMLHKLSENNIKLQSGFIIGLPGDSEESIYKTFDKLSLKEIFSCWAFSPLLIYGYSDIDESISTLSPIEKNPLKYGYEVTKYDNTTRFAHWKNKDMTWTDSVRIWNDLESKSRKIMTVGGWSLPTAWHLGDSEYTINNTVLSELNLQERGENDVRQRAITTIKKFT